MDHTYTIQEVATKLNLSDKTLRRWEDAGRFRSSRTLGNQRRYTIEDIQILDAIKHGTINSQRELLTLSQAASFCGVSTTTFTRWEDAGKIHPLITSGNTYYPKERLSTILSSLQSSIVQDELLKPLPPEPSPVPPTPSPKPSPIIDRPKLSPMPPLVSKKPDYVTTLTHTLISILLLVVYHLFFNAQTPSTSQNTGSVQGTSTQIQQDPRIDDLIVKFKEHLATQMLKDAKPVAPTTIQLDNTSLIYGSSTLPKDKDQVSVTAPEITPTTPVTVSFTSDYAPAKKYWVTVSAGSFTLHTDFPVSTDSSFNYSIMESAVSSSSGKIIENRL